MAGDALTSRRSDQIMSWLWYWPAGGCDFDKWKSAQKWKPIRSEQSGRAELLPLDDFKSQADKWRGISKEILGTLTDQPPKIFFSSRRRHTRFDCDWSSDVCSSD